jgi:hypothetical protein
MKIVKMLHDAKTNSTRVQCDKVHKKDTPDDG